MSDAASELPNRFHLLRLAKLVFALSQLELNLPARRCLATRLLLRRLRHTPQIELPCAYGPQPLGQVQHDPLGRERRRAGRIGPGGQREVSECAGRPDDEQRDPGEQDVARRPKALSQTRDGHSELRQYQHCAQRRRDDVSNGAQQGYDHGSCKSGVADCPQDEIQTRRVFGRLEIVPAELNPKIHAQAVNDPDRRMDP